MVAGVPGGILEVTRSGSGDMRTLRIGRRTLWFRLVTWVPILAGIPAPAGAQVPSSPDPTATRLLSDSARVSLVTVMPGRKVYSMFGHNAIRVFDPARGIDESYNYGTFHFGNPLIFSAKFAYGDLNYRLSREDFQRWAAYYPVVEGRPILEQVLDLDEDEKDEIYRFLEWNALPENAYYRYDFYFDNCATRIRDLLEEVLGERLTPAEVDPDATLRQLLDPYLGGRSWLHFAMDAGQGRPADVPATWRSALFLPDRLAEWAAGSRLSGDGGPRPLVAVTDSIGWERAASLPSGRTNWPAVVMTVFLGLVVWLTVVDLSSPRGSGRAWLDVPVLVVLGGAGLTIVFLWFVSLHEVTRANLNLLWALPTNLFLAIRVRRTAGRKWRLALLVLTAACAGVFVLGWPFWTQELPLATLPLSTAVAVRAGGLALLERRAEGARTSG